MRQACRCGRVMFATCAYGNFGVEAGFFMGFGEVDGEAVVEFVDVHVHRVIGIGRIDALEPGKDR